MRNWILLTIVVSSSMLAATAAAQTQTQSQSPRCNSLEQNLPECQTIGVSAAADGGILNLLSKDLPIVPIEQTATSVFPSHLVIGAADLDNPQIIALLRRSYRVGKTVAIVGATQGQVDRFHSLLQGSPKANCLLPQGRPISALYGLQRSLNRFPPQSSSYCLINLDLQRPASDRKWLRERFGLTPPQPPAGKLASTGNFTLSSKVTSTPNAATDSTNPFLTNLADATDCGGRITTSNGTIQSDAYIYSMRNFTDTGCPSCQGNPGADYYLVQDYATFQSSSSQVVNYEVGAGNLVDTADNVPFASGSYFLEFADPQTATSYESSYTNESSSTASGSVGVSADGPNVTEGGSTTTSQSATWSVPPTIILNQSNLAGGLPDWIFTPQTLPLYTDYQVNPTWTWFIPKAAYPSTGIGTSGAVQFRNLSVLLSALVDNNYNVLGSLDSVCTPLYPFPAWSISAVALTSITPPASGAGGQTFTINGSDIYPGNVVGVSIEGMAVPDTDWSVVVPPPPTPGAAQPPPYITVILPQTYRSGSYSVSVTSSINDNDVLSTNPNDVVLVVP